MIVCITTIFFQELNAIRHTIRSENYDVDTGEWEESADALGRRVTSYWSRQLHSLQPMIQS